MYIAILVILRHLRLPKYYSSTTTKRKDQESYFMYKQKTDTTDKNSLQIPKRQKYLQCDTCDEKPANKLSWMATSLETLKGQGHEI